MADAKFINCKKTLQFTKPKARRDDPEGRFLVPKDFIGSVPGWVTETWLFNAACKDGTITFVGNTPSAGATGGKGGGSKGKGLSKQNEPPKTESDKSESGEEQ